MKKRYWFVNLIRDGINENGFECTYVFNKHPLSFEKKVWIFTIRFYKELDDEEIALLIERGINIDSETGIASI